jgi:hypothetical protein
MRARTLLLLLALVATSAFAGSARADSVFIGQRELHGEIAEETSDHVVLRTGSGTITIPRKVITKVVHEEEAATLLNEARALARNLDVTALDLFDRAIELLKKKGDTDGAQAAAKERVKLAARLDHEKQKRAAPEADPAELADGSLFLLARDREEVAILVRAHDEGDKSAGNRAGVKLNELALRHVADLEARWAVGCFALARDLDETNAKYYYDAETRARRKACGAAIQAQDAKIALAAIAPLVKDQPKDPHVAYLEARSLEVAGRPADAKLAYRRALESVTIPDVADLPLDLLREFTRMLLRGEPPKDGSPGFGPSWTRLETAHFIVYHQLGELFRDDEVKFFEDARDQALVRLGFAESDVDKLGKVPLFFFADQKAYTAAGGERWAGGHAQHAELEDGTCFMICTFPGRRSSDAATIPHEIAHVFLRAGLPGLDLPVWANEGAAMHCEPDEFQARRRAYASRLFELNRWVKLGDFFARVTLDPNSDLDSVRAFYGESYVAFDEVGELAGGVKPALKLAVRMVRKGADPALKELGTSADALDEKLRAKLTRSP